MATDKKHETKSSSGTKAEQGGKSGAHTTKTSGNSSSDKKSGGKK